MSPQENKDEQRDITSSNNLVYNSSSYINSEDKEHTVGQRVVERLDITSSMDRRGRTGASSSSELKETEKEIVSQERRRSVRIDMPRLILTKGLPASGKTTWAVKYKKDHPNTEIVCKDDIREILKVHEGSKNPSESRICAIRDKMIQGYLNVGRDVIVADTNLNPVHEKSLRSLFSNSADIEVKFFNVDPRECVKRDAKREDKIGPVAIWGMYNKYLKGKEQ